METTTTNKETPKRIGEGAIGNIGTTSRSAVTDSTTILSSPPGESLTGLRSPEEESTKIQTQHSVELNSSLSIRSDDNANNSNRIRSSLFSSIGDYYNSTLNSIRPVFDEAKKQGYSFVSTPILPTSLYSIISAFVPFSSSSPPMIMSQKSSPSPSSSEQPNESLTSLPRSSDCTTTTADRRQSFSYRKSLAEKVELKRLLPLPSSTIKHRLYNKVTRRNGNQPESHLRRNSVDDVRQLLALISDNEEEEGNDNSFGFSVSESMESFGSAVSGSASAGVAVNDPAFLDTILEESNQHNRQLNLITNLDASYDSISMNQHSHNPQQPSVKREKVSESETASHLAEGTIRALRDLALDEALELQRSLRYWSELHDRPVLSYLQTRISVWKSQGQQLRDNKNHSIHNCNNDGVHQMVGRKISQIQAVLARRCARIGELQQHLLRAGWQGGVAQWGILGQGSEWAPIAGIGDGRIAADTSNGFIGDSVEYVPDSSNSFQHHYPFNIKQPHEKTKKRSNYYGEAHLFVKKSRGGQIVSNDMALAAWSVDAIRVVRDQLYLAGDGMTPLPCFEHWPQEEFHFLEKGGYVSMDHSGDTGDSTKSINHRDGDMKAEGSTRNINKLKMINDLVVDDAKMSKNLPIWAMECGSGIVSDASNHDHNQPSSSNKSLACPSNIGKETPSELEDAKNSDKNHEEILVSSSHKNKSGNIVITDIQLMAAEVSKILDAMEIAMENQRCRRLEKLKPPSRLLRNWYVAAIAVPFVGYVTYKLMKNRAGAKLAVEAYRQTISFCSEHISEPLQSIYQELFRGRVDVTDRKARSDAIKILKEMIKRWLDEFFPNMPESERTDRATAMDISLIEKRKADSIQNILEINSIVHMSLIEMQFIKKELMNALYAMDELMGSNEINMKLAAMTPAFLIASGIRYVFRFLFYALLKLGKSKEETYASFRLIVLDIERLLVMRENPPSAPPPLISGVIGTEKLKFDGSSQVVPSSETMNFNSSMERQSVLNSDDLGMLMLLVHECRIILWQNRRRFSRQELRNVSEDLAELAGERGAVSVHQQLNIITRICRTYSFLNVMSSDISFYSGNYI